MTMARVSTGSERRPQVPAKLRTAEVDAVTKPCEVTPSTVRSAFAVISSRFPSELSLQDLQAFVKAHGLGISRATLREMVGRASAKRRGWRARGRDLPRRVMRDKLWVEDVMWALRVRKTRREFDKWEVNEHRKEWVSILEAATPENPTVFATSPDHRVAPPLSYTELLHDSAPVFSSPPSAAGWTFVAAQGGSNTSVSTSYRGSDSGRRPATTGRMWKPLESRLPTSLLLASRPVSAKVRAGAVVGDLVGSTEGGISTFGDGTPWEGDGGVGDSTVWCFPSGAGVGNSSGENGDDSRHCGGGGTEAGHSEGYGAVRWPIVTAQERALFGRKPSPAMVARSTCYAPRRRPLYSADRRRVRPNNGDGDDIAKLFKMEIDINGSSFIPAASSDHLSSTGTTQQHGPSDGRGTTRAGVSIASALTFDDYADLFHFKNTAAAEDVQTALAEATREAGPAVEETEKAIRIQTASSSGTFRANNKNRNDAPGTQNLDEVVSGGGGGCIAVDVVNTEPEALVAGSDRIPTASVSAIAPSTHGDVEQQCLPPRPSSPSQLSSGDREGRDSRPSATDAVISTDRAGAAAPAALGPTTAAPYAEGPKSSVSAIEAGAPARETTNGNGGGRDVTDKIACRDHPQSRPASGGDKEEAAGGEGVAAWWRDALAPASRRPVTRRSLVCGWAAGGGTRSTGCIRGPGEGGARGNGPREHGGCRWSVHGTVRGAEASGGDRKRSATAAPICGFSTESKHRGLEDFLDRRSSIAESEGLAAARVEGWEQAFARARSGAPFRQFVGRGTIRENFDDNLRDKARETLALDLRGYGTNLVAPETTTTTTTTTTTAIETAKMVAAGFPFVEHEPLSPPRQEGRATAGAAVAEKRARARTTTRAWSSTRVEGGGESGAAMGSSEPPPFRANRGPTVQESRAAVVTHQVGMWGKCAQAQFGRFEEKPYVHSFRPHTSHGIRRFGPSSPTSNSFPRASMALRQTMTN